jgi:shikimate kinase
VSGHVYLIGFMGAGKSTVGSTLAGVLERPFVDLDDEIERADRRSIPQIFAEDGETGFRLLETDALRAVSQGPPSVVACGGGVVTAPDNLRIMRDTGTVVYLAADIETVGERLGSGRGRPLFGPDAASLLESRRSLYEEWADKAVSTDNRSVGDVTSDVAAMVEDG